jgi:hypothetical protein
MITHSQKLVNIKFFANIVEFFLLNQPNNYQSNTFLELLKSTKKELPEKYLMALNNRKNEI